MAGQTSGQQSTSKGNAVAQAAKKFVQNKYAYVYGGKGEEICKGTKSHIQGLRNSYGIKHYPHIFGNSKDGYGRNYAADLNKAHSGHYMIDCSGLTRAAFKNGAGIDIGGGSSNQNSYGKAHAKSVSFSEARAGDLLWKSGHVGIVGENGKTVEAASWNLGCINYRSISIFSKVYRIVSGGTAVKSTTTSTSKSSSSSSSSGNLLNSAQVNTAIAWYKRQNFTKAYIKEIQNVIGTTPDGAPGKLTAQAAAKWQKKHGLTADGEFGNKSAAKAGLTPKYNGKSSNASQRKSAQKTQAKDTAVSSGKIPSGNITSHFSWKEAACHNGEAVPAKYRDRTIRLCKNLEVLRSALGKPISIHCIYRSPSYNAKISGSAKNSQHTYAAAADFHVSGYTPAQVRAKIESLIKAGKMEQGGMGRYNTFVHYDVRGYRARW